MICMFRYEQEFDSYFLILIQSIDLLLYDMNSHGSNIDSMILQAYLDQAFVFIGKKSLFLIPIIGWVGRWCFKCVPINRSNRSNALKSLDLIGQVVHQEHRSIAISPEGTRSINGQLGSFKKGPFYLQEDANVPVLPVLLLGAHECWPPQQSWITSGQAICRILRPFRPDAGKSKDLNRLALRRIFLRASSEMDTSSTWL